MSRISSGTVLLAILAVTFGLLGAYYVQQTLKKKPIEVVEAAAETPVVVPLASAPLKAGRRVSLGDIALMPMTRAQMKEAGVQRGFMANPQQIIGRILREDMVAGTTFTTSSLYPEGTGPNVVDRLEVGYRAITVPVAHDALVSGFAQPGSFVDVLFRAEASKTDDLETLPELTVVLLTGVEVLAVDQYTLEDTQVGNASPRDEQAKINVTLAVTPRQAMELHAVDGRGVLSLSLRHPDELAAVERMSPATLDDVLGRPNQLRMKMEVYRGNQLSKVQFKEDERITPTISTIADAPGVMKAIPSSAGPAATP